MEVETKPKKEEKTMAEEEVDLEPDMTYTKELRSYTKEVHKMSDVLVNAKFAFALSDDAVWADALLCFHEIYKFLEKHLPEELLPKEFHRAEAFQKDLDYFLGDDWKEDYEPRESVKKYLEHLEQVRQTSTTLLFAYAFQMYMALMSGGQLLQKKRMIARKLWMGKRDEEVENIPNSTSSSSADDLQSRPMPVQVTICPEGCAATYFPQKISVLKAKLRNIMNKHYGNMNAEEKAAFVEESKNVFLFNGDVVRSVRGTNRANLKKLAMVLVFVVGVYFALKFAKR